MNVQPALSPTRARPGPRSSVNLLTQEIEDVAEAIKLRLMNTTGAVSVYVDPSDGSVLTERVCDVRRSVPLPDEWLVGTYTRAAKVYDLEDDLVERWHEIKPGRRAAE